MVLTNRFGMGSIGGLVGGLAGGRSTGGWGGPEGGQGSLAGGFLEDAVEEDLANGSTRIGLLLPEKNEDVNDMTDKRKKEKVKITIFVFDQAS